MLDQHASPTSTSSRPTPRRPLRLPPRLRVVRGGRPAPDSIGALRERRLMLAALDDAIRTILGANPAFDGRPIHRRREIAWLRSRNLRHPFTYERICMRLGIDPDHLRGRVLRAARRAGTLVVLLALLGGAPPAFAAEPRAHLGTAARVTNLRNGRHVVVHIDDRGPYVAPRVLDLSLAAARPLDMVDCGLADVLIEPL